MIPQTSPAHGVITALVDRVPRWLQAADLTAQVLDGPSAQQLEKDTVVIGIGDPAVITQRGEPDFGGRRTELGEIVCVISCWDGDVTTSTKRQRAYALLAAIEDGLRTDPQLTDLDGTSHADDCIIGSDLELTQRQANGALAALGFTIRYEAHI